MVKDRDGNWVQSGDEELNPLMEAAEMAIAKACTGSKCGLPANGLLQIRVLFSNSANALCKSLSFSRLAMMTDFTKKLVAPKQKPTNISMLLSHMSKLLIVIAL